jgi:tRNA-modifying protein YgfZ
LTPVSIGHAVRSVPRQTGGVDPNSDDPAFIDPSARDRVIVAGPDASSYLQSQIAQDIRDQAVGETRWSLVLEPTGKVTGLARVTRRDDDCFVLDIDAGFGEALAARLSRFKIRVAAEVSVEPAERDAPSDDHENARIEIGWPRMGFEILPGETIPAMMGGVVAWSVNFTKGCYPGQELVERMDSRGADAPRSLRIVDVEPGTSPGDPVVDVAGAEIGTVTSVAPGGRRALAYLKRGNSTGTTPNF